MHTPEASTEGPKAGPAWLRSEDWWALWLGLALLLLALVAAFGWNPYAWAVRPRIWTWGSFSWQTALAVRGEGWHPLAALAVNYAVLTALLGAGAACMGYRLGRFLAAWTAIFLLTWSCWILGHEAHLAAHVNEFERYGIEFGLSLGGGAAYLLALLVGLLIGNAVRPLAAFLREAAKPEWFIKAAIVCLGVKIGLQSIEAAGFAFELALAGACATFVAYLLFWPLIYALARRVFGFRRDASAVLASGLSICGVSAAIATAGAIRARPSLPVVVSVLVVVFAMIELIVLPPLYAHLAPDAPIVNGAAMGMTVKTDGADAAAGAILDELMRSRAAERGIHWQEGWILTAAVMTKIWIDMFIGVWAFVLAWLWLRHVEGSPYEQRIPLREIWNRFPKFVLGYFLAWGVYLAIGQSDSAWSAAAQAGAAPVAGELRKFLFMATFLGIGLITDFRELRGMGRMALLYATGLVFIVAPIAYAVAWVFHRGMLPPAATG
ncbi:MAG: membrane protein [Gammaproteobacteria bacterium]|nr:MAG: membrane protein [Gammaproteobacteria bacterium]